MGAGTASVGTFQKQEPSGAPFPAGSANNGLSVDPVTGKIVLGNDDPGILATLLSNREVPMAGFNISFSNIPGDLFSDIRPNTGFRVHDAAFDRDTVVGRGFIQMTDNIGAGPIIQMITTIGQIELRKVGNTQVFVIDDGTGPPSLALLSLNFTNALSIIGDVNTLGNGTFLQLDDPNTIISLNTAINGVVASTALVVNGAAGTYQFGDSDTSGNGNRLLINDSINQFSLGVNGVASYLFIDSGVRQYSLGDISGLVNSTYLQIDDVTQTFNFRNATMGLALINPQNGTFRIATPAVNALLQILDSSGANGIQILSQGIIGTLSGAAITIAGAGGLILQSTTMLHSSVSYTNGAAASIGTLTNAPAPGNPTKWIPIDDNGTTRFMPAW